ncbi:MAG: hypothetical protein B6244_13345 [Candidatus Cloacimonetes bacterium 4572_55]|nr:MAG: hypothetical protein B6244_13345 [Candidatus Cloacimonetes bacterium 4572_55]
MKTMPFDKNRAGFSLIELLVAMTVSGIFLGGAFQIFMMQSRVFNEINRTREAQQEMRIALDLITADFRSLQSSGVERVWVSFDALSDTMESSTGMIIKDGPDNTPDSLFVFNFSVASDPSIAAQFRMQTSSTTGMTSLSSSVTVESTQPLQDYIDARGLEAPSPEIPILARIWGGYTRDDQASFIPFDCGGETYDVPIISGNDGNGQLFAITNMSANTLAHTQTPTSPWNPTANLLHRWGMPEQPTYGPGQTVECSSNGPTAAGPNPAFIEPARFLGWYIYFDDSINRYRLVRVEDALREVVADNVRDFQIIPPDPSASILTVKLEVWIPKPGSSPLSGNRDDFIVRADSTKFYRAL